MELSFCPSDYADQARRLLQLAQALALHNTAVQALLPQLTAAAVNLNGSLHNTIDDSDSLPASQLRVNDPAPCISPRFYIELLEDARSVSRHVQGHAQAAKLASSRLAAFHSSARQAARVLDAAGQVRAELKRPSTGSAGSSSQAHTGGFCYYVRIRRDNPSLAPGARSHIPSAGLKLQAALSLRVHYPTDLPLLLLQLDAEERGVADGEVSAAGAPRWPVHHLGDGKRGFRCVQFADVLPALECGPLTWADGVKAATAAAEALVPGSSEAVSQHLPPGYGARHPLADVVDLEQVLKEQRAKKRGKGKGASKVGAGSQDVSAGDDGSKDVIEDEVVDPVPALVLGMPLSHVQAVVHALCRPIPGDLLLLVDGIRPSGIDEARRLLYTPRQEDAPAATIGSSRLGRSSMGVGAGAGASSVPREQREDTVLCCCYRPALDLPPGLVINECEEWPTDSAPGHVDAAAVQAFAACQPGAASRATALQLSMLHSQHVQRRRAVEVLGLHTLARTLRPFVHSGRPLRVPRAPLRTGVGVGVGGRLGPQDRHGESGRPDPWPRLAALLSGRVDWMPPLPSHAEDGQGSLPPLRPGHAWLSRVEGWCRSTLEHVSSCVRSAGVALERAVLLAEEIPASMDIDSEEGAVSHPSPPSPRDAVRLVLSARLKRGAEGSGTHPCLPAAYLVRTVSPHGPSQIRLYGSVVDWLRGRQCTGPAICVGTPARTPTRAHASLLTHSVQEAESLALESRPCREDLVSLPFLLDRVTACKAALPLSHAGESGYSHRAYGWLRGTGGREEESHALSGGVTASPPFPLCVSSTGMLNLPSKPRGVLRPGQTRPFGAGSAGAQDRPLYLLACRPCSGAEEQSLPRVLSSLLAHVERYREGEGEGEGGRAGQEAAAMGVLRLLPSSRSSPSLLPSLLTRFRHLLTLSCHRGLALWSVVSDPWGRTLFTGADDGLIKAWCARTGALQYTLRKFNGAVSHVLVSPDSRMLAACGDESVPPPPPQVAALGAIPVKRLGGGFVLRLWQAGTGAAHAVLHGHTLPVNGLGWDPAHPSLLLSCSDDGTLRVWDSAGAFTAAAQARARNITRSADEAGAAVDGVGVAQSGGVPGAGGGRKREGREEGATTATERAGTAATSSNRIFDVNPESERCIIGEHRSAGSRDSPAVKVNCLSVCPTGGFVATGDDTGSVRVWQYLVEAGGIGEGFTVEQEGEGVADGENASYAPSVSFATDDPSATAADAVLRRSRDQEGHIRDPSAILALPPAPICVREMKAAHAAEVDCVLYSPRGTRLLSLSTRDASAPVRVWSWAQGYGSPCSLKLDVAQAALTSCPYAYGLAGVPLSEGGSVKPISVGAPLPLQLDGVSLCAGSGVSAWTGEGGSAAPGMGIDCTGYPIRVHAAAWTCDESRIVVSVMRAGGGEEEGMGASSDPNPKHKRDSTSSWAKLHMPSVHRGSGSTPLRSMGLTLPHPSLECMPVSGSEVRSVVERDPHVQVWDAHTGAVLATIRGHSSDVHLLCPHPYDPSLLLTAGWDGRVLLCDVLTGGVLARWQAFTHASPEHVHKAFLAGQIDRATALKLGMPESLAQAAVVGTGGLGGGGGGGGWGGGEEEGEEGQPSAYTRAGGAAEDESESSTPTAPPRWVTSEVVQTLDHASCLDAGWMPDGRRFVVADDDGCVRMFGIADDACVEALSLVPFSQYLSLDFSPIHRDGAGETLDAATQREPHELFREQTLVNEHGAAIAFRPGAPRPLGPAHPSSLPVHLPPHLELMRRWAIMGVGAALNARLCGSVEQAREQQSRAQGAGQARLCGLSPGPLAMPVRGGRGGGGGGSPARPSPVRPVHGTRGGGRAGGGAGNDLISRLGRDPFFGLDDESASWLRAQWDGKAYGEVVEGQRRARAARAKSRLGEGGGGGGTQEAMGEDGGGGAFEVFGSSDEDGEGGRGRGGAKRRRIGAGAAPSSRLPGRPASSLPLPTYADLALDSSSSEGEGGQEEGGEGYGVLIVRDVFARVPTHPHPGSSEVAEGGGAVLPSFTSADDTKVPARRCAFCGRGEEVGHAPPPGNEDGPLWGIEGRFLPYPLYLASGSGEGSTIAAHSGQRVRLAWVHANCAAMTAQARCRDEHTDLLDSLSALYVQDDGPGGGSGLSPPALPLHPSIAAWVWSTRDDRDDDGTGVHMVQPASPTATGSNGTAVRPADPVPCFVWYNVGVEVQRARFVKCKRCGKSGAALGCILSSCAKSYHMRCAIEEVGWAGWRGGLGPGIPHGSDFAALNASARGLDVEKAKLLEASSRSRSSKKGSASLAALAAAAGVWGAAAIEPVPDTFTAFLCDKHKGRSIQPPPLPPAVSRTRTSHAPPRPDRGDGASLEDIPEGLFEDERDGEYTGGGGVRALGRAAVGRRAGGRGGRDVASLSMVGDAGVGGGRSGRTAYVPGMYAEDEGAGSECAPSSRPGRRPPPLPLPDRLSTHGHCGTEAELERSLMEAAKAGQGAERAAVRAERELLVYRQSRLWSSSWLRCTRPLPFTYSPQVGDCVVYVPAGHAAVLLERAGGGEEGEDVLQTAPFHGWALSWVAVLAVIESVVVRHASRVEEEHARARGYTPPQPIEHEGKGLRAGGKGGPGPGFATPRKPSHSHSDTPLYIVADLTLRFVGVSEGTRDPTWAGMGKVNWTDGKKTRRFAPPTTFNLTYHPGFSADGPDFLLLRGRYEQAMARAARIKAALHKQALVLKAAALAEAEAEAAAEAASLTSSRKRSAALPPPPPPPPGVAVRAPMADSEAATWDEGVVYRTYGGHSAIGGGAVYKDAAELEDASRGGSQVHGGASDAPQEVYLAYAEARKGNANVAAGVASLPTAVPPHAASTTGRSSSRLRLVVQPPASSSASAGVKLQAAARSMDLWRDESGYGPMTADGDGRTVVPHKVSMALLGGFLLPVDQSPLLSHFMPPPHTCSARATALLHRTLSYTWAIVHAVGEPLDGDVYDDESAVVRGVVARFPGTPWACLRVRWGPDRLSGGAARHPLGMHAHLAEHLVSAHSALLDTSWAFLCPWEVEDEDVTTLEEYTLAAVHEWAKTHGLDALEMPSAAAALPAAPAVLLPKVCSPPPPVAQPLADPGRPRRAAAVGGGPPEANPGEVVGLHGRPRRAAAAAASKRKYGEVDEEEEEEPSGAPRKRMRLGGSRTAGSGEADEGEEVHAFAPPDCEPPAAYDHPWLALATLTRFDVGQPVHPAPGGSAGAAHDSIAPLLVSISSSGGLGSVTAEMALLPLLVPTEKLSDAGTKLLIERVRQLRGSVDARAFLVSPDLPQPSPSEVEEEPLPAPDPRHYAALVALPMDLTTILGRLMGAYYRSVAQLRQDVRTLRSNCANYNLAGSSIVHLAGRLHDLLQGWIDEAVGVGAWTSDARGEVAALSAGGGTAGLDLDVVPVRHPTPVIASQLREAMLTVLAKISALPRSDIFFWPVDTAGLPDYTTYVSRVWAYEDVAGRVEATGGGGGATGGRSGRSQVVILDEDDGPVAPGRRRGAIGAAPTPLPPARVPPTPTPQPYATLAEFARDVLQVPANALAYNPSWAPVGMMAAGLRVCAVEALRAAASELGVDVDDPVHVQEVLDGGGAIEQQGQSSIFAGPATSLRAILAWPMPRDRDTS